MPSTSPGDAPAWLSPRSRTLVYALLLTALASWLGFTDLGADALSGDEAQYALCVQHVKQSGDWMSISPYPPTVYLQKPPLYFWLSASTYSLFDQHETAFRAWSAMAGVACVVLTALLGAAMLTPELGALASLVLLTNRAFLLRHGMRSGTFDVLLTLFVLVCVLAYWLRVSGRVRGGAWVVIGVAAGLASLTKPLAGLPILGLLALHALLFERGRDGAGRRVLAGLAVALLVSVMVAAPWYLAQWHRHGQVFVHEMFLANLVLRARAGLDRLHREPWFFYLRQVTRSSGPFALFIPAMIAAAVASAAGGRRRASALVALVVIGLVTIFSFSVSKMLHYLYPAFPLIAIAITAFASEALRLATRAVREQCTRRSFRQFGFAVALIALLMYSCRLVYQTIPSKRTRYEPWELYRTFAPAVRDGRARLVLYGWPETQVRWRDELHLLARDCYYVEQMWPHAQRPATPETLTRLLEERAPTLLAVPRPAYGAASVPGNWARDPIRSDPRFLVEYPAFQMAGVDLTNLLETRWTPNTHSPLLEPRLISGSAVVSDGLAFKGRCEFTVRPPLKVPAVVTMNLRLPPGRPVSDFVPFSAYVGDKKISGGFARVVEARSEIVAAIEADQWAHGGDTVLSLKILPRQDEPDPVDVVLLEARVDYHPKLPKSDAALEPE